LLVLILEPFQGLQALRSNIARGDGPLSEALIKILEPNWGARVVLCTKMALARIAVMMLLKLNFVPDDILNWEGFERGVVVSDLLCCIVDAGIYSKKSLLLMRDAGIVIRFKVILESITTGYNQELGQLYKLQLLQLVSVTLQKSTTTNAHFYCAILRRKQPCRTGKGRSFCTEQNLLLGCELTASRTHSDATVHQLIQTGQYEQCEQCRG
jgi:hypothetical protein